MVSHDNYESFVIAHARAALRNALRATLSRRVRTETGTDGAAQPTG